MVVFPENKICRNVMECPNCGYYSPASSLERWQEESMYIVQRCTSETITLSHTYIHEHTAPAPNTHIHVTNVTSHLDQQCWSRIKGLRPRPKQGTGSSSTPVKGSSRTFTIRLCCKNDRIISVF